MSQLLHKNIRRQPISQLSTKEVHMEPQQAIVDTSIDKTRKLEKTTRISAKSLNDHWMLALLLGCFVIK